MKKTADMLREIEVMLRQAELRISLLNGELAEFLNDRADLLEFQLELENIHHVATKLENTLLKKMLLTKRNLEATKAKE